MLLLCNDREVVGPWVNGRATNAFTSLVVAVLVMLSTVLTASVLFTDITGAQIVAILGVGGIITMLAGAVLLSRRTGSAPAVVDRSERAVWRMPPLHLLVRPELSAGRRIGLTVLRAYLFVAMALVVVRVVQLALSR